MLYFVVNRLNVEVCCLEGIIGVIVVGMMDLCIFIFMFYSVVLISVSVKWLKNISGVNNEVIMVSVINI